MLFMFTLCFLLNLDITLNVKTKTDDSCSMPQYLFIDEYCIPSCEIESFFCNRYHPTLYTSLY